MLTFTNSNPEDGTGQLPKISFSRTLVVANCKKNVTISVSNRNKKKHCHSDQLCIRHYKICISGLDIYLRISLTIRNLENRTCVGTITT